MDRPLTQLQRLSPPTAPHQVQSAGHLQDAHGRVITDLRLSLTDRCNFRCRYCMEPDDRFLPKRALLSMQDYLLIVDAAISLGIRKVRLTGGEPTLYPDLDPLIRELGNRGLDDLAMTTNGWHLDPGRADQWRQTGLVRLTFSLDTLQEDRFREITRSESTVDDVLQSVDTAIRSGFSRPKINVVAIKDFNDDEFVDFAALARSRDLDVRFIEYMPLNSARDWTQNQVITANHILQAIQTRYPLVEETATNPHSTSQRYRFADATSGRIGIIAPVTRPFCGACNRLRVTAEGAVRPCLFSNTEWDLRPVLRSGASKADVAAFLRDAVYTKQAGHGIGNENFQQPARGMSAIGG